MSQQSDRKRKAVVRARVTPQNPKGLPVVAIVGRPNVGKSTLINRIAGRREAIVQELPGVTRDRKDIEVSWTGRPFIVQDTGGWLVGGTDLDKKVSAQSEVAVREADLVLFVCDVTVGVTSEDEDMADIVRRARGRGDVLVVANKVDSDTRESDRWAMSALGLGEPWAISALHGRGTGDMLDEVIRRLPDQSEDGAAEAPAQDTGDEAVRTTIDASDDGTSDDGTSGDDVSRDEDEDDDAAFVDSVTPEGRKPGQAFRGEGLGGQAIPAIVIAGRPNVGKSTLFNRLIGEDRAVVHDMPGTTRDSIDTVIETEHGTVRFVDTAGMRRRSRVDAPTEYFSTVRALNSIDRSDACLFVIDSTEGITHQDQRLAERIDGAGCPIIIVLNKWEMIDNEAREDVIDKLEERLSFLAYSPVLKISAQTGMGVHKLLPALTGAVTEYHRRVPTRKLNELIQAAQAAHPGREARVLYATQGATDPPTFTLFANRDLSPQYLRYLERKIREKFEFGATPLKLRVRRRGD